MFTGFQSGDRRIQLPERFFAEVLPQITNPAELKVALHVFWLLAGKVGRPRLVSFGELAADEVLARSLTAGKSPRSAEDWLREGLELCVARGTLLHLIVQPEDEPPEKSESWYLVSTAYNKRWVEQVVAGAIDPANTVLASSHLLAALHDSTGGAKGTNGAHASNGAASGEKKNGAAERPRLKVSAKRRTIFDLYEQNIGVITPLMAEQLQEAAAKYPQAWVEEAFLEAVNYNKRNWSYVRRILERWAERGRENGEAGQDNSRALDPGKYLSGKYAHLFNRR